MPFEVAIHMSPLWSTAMLLMTLSDSPSCPFLIVLKAFVCCSQIPSPPPSAPIHSSPDFVSRKLRTKRLGKRFEISQRASSILNLCLEGSSIFTPPFDVPIHLRCS